MNHKSENETGFQSGDIVLSPSVSGVSVLVPTDLELMGFLPSGTSR